MFAIGDREWPGISKLAEEAGEVLQVVGKLMGTGGEVRHWNVADLKRALEDEVADLAAAIEFVSRRCGLDEVRMRARVLEKMQRFERWHDEGTARRGRGRS